MEARLLSITPKKVKKLAEEITFKFIDENGIKSEIKGLLNKSKNYFFAGYRHGNSYIFSVLKLNKEEVSRKVLGYYIDGDWPECKTIEDFNKMLNYLRCYEEI